MLDDPDFISQVTLTKVREKQRASSRGFDIVLAVSAHLITGSVCVCPVHFVFSQGVCVL